MLFERKIGGNGTYLAPLGKIKCSRVYRTGLAIVKPTN
jgi:hypothetical protein